MGSVWTHMVIYWSQQNNSRHLCLHVRTSGTVGWMCNTCSQTSSHHHVCWLSCAVRATDIGPQALQATSSVTIHVWRYCVVVSHERTCQICASKDIVTRSSGHSELWISPHTLLLTVNQNFLIPFQALYCNAAIYLSLLPALISLPICLCMCEYFS